MIRNNKNQNNKESGIMSRNRKMTELFRTIELEEQKSWPRMRA